MPPKERKVGKQIYFKKRRVQFVQVEFELPDGHPGCLYKANGDRVLDVISGLEMKNHQLLGSNEILEDYQRENEE